LAEFQDIAIVDIIVNHETIAADEHRKDTEMYPEIKDVAKK